MRNDKKYNSMNATIVPVKESCSSAWNVLTTVNKADLAVRGALT